ncbi:PLP-dependent aminotransferase family protein [Rathayibacter toxicus]|uniref:PLP-dependent aminotransferase family protein n=1 Tax=Rathayibacter toxicus TaxID=145458 RepID=A0A2S5YA47_9MICO|nr:PLP-dependent aminotransferase family protein [Rathayibacter toxicus]PPH25581.1 PLP-dependent aminotransferase family protein [Rathayibacter toxicus]PPH59280.1 PLP-dependent aminotransferase family protein [Rathayibacter toxicus]PPH61393.1 PLP-dependent aminotransferase family protein [Rathayibacter toxicus]PPH89359.1 PLP-dependent aminotransferase family protein [Rathayibacter toxicus]PPI17183.1 PLP-dependent aminotransferase family protein [Rathayibacter toxicus]
MTNHGNNLDPWFNSYAERTAGLAASEVRALFAVASRPEVVSLAGGMPFVSALPPDLVSDAIDSVLRENGSVALQYGSGQGIPILREQILDVMALEGITASADDVVITTGSQHALDLVSKLFLNPEDVVLSEGPSYVTAMVIFRSYQAEIEHVLMDEHGLIPAALQESIDRIRASGKTIKFLYTIPTFHNPAGVTLSWQRRIEILEICKAEGILVLEDNPYGLLYFDETPPKALRSLNEDGVIYLGTFSKILAPGLRVGWALAPHAIRERLVLANEAAVLSPSPFSQLVISRYLETANWREQIATFRGVYRERNEAMLHGLQTHLPDLQWTTPRGGFYIWVTLPEGLDAKAMLPRAVKELVAYTPGTAFYGNGDGRRNIRLSFCYPTPERIGEGIRRLATVINGEIDLLSTFAGTGSLTSSHDSRHVSVLPPHIS